jgi:hypothetical protein
VLTVTPGAGPALVGTGTWRSPVPKVVSGAGGPHFIRLGAEFVAARVQTDDAERISTGSLALDLLLGGLPRGAITA